MSPTLKRLLRWGLSLAIIALLVVFAREVNWAETWRAIRTASLPLLLAAALLNLSSIVLKGVRWWIFLRPIGSPSLGLAVRATTAGAGLNNVLVANGGDAARVLFVSRATGVSSARVLATLALERLFDPICYVLLLAGSTMLLPLPRELERWRIPAAIALVVMLGLMVLLIRAPGGESLTAAGAAEVADVALPESFLVRARRYGRNFTRSVTHLSTGPRFAAALALSLIAWATQVGTYALTASAAHSPLPLAGNIAVLLAVNLGLIIRATPGNVGFFQFVYALTAEQFGVQRDAAIAVAFLIQTLQILPVTLLGVALAPEFVFRRGKGATAA
jgi:uncharacterized protein (TIRG00374 family)